MRKLAATGNPIVKKNIVIFLVDFFAKSNLKNYFDKFFAMVQELSADDGTLVKYYTLDVISSIIGKNSNKEYQQISFEILSTYLSLGYWRLNYGFIKNFRALGKLWVNNRDDESLVGEYMKYLRSESKEVQLIALEHIPELVDIVEFNKCKKPLVELLKQLIATEPGLKRISIQQLFVFIHNEENEQQKQYLTSYLLDLLERSDNGTKLFIMLQFDDLTRMLTVEKAVKMILDNLGAHYESFGYEERLEAVKVVRNLLEIDKIFENEEFYQLAKTRILADRFFKVRIGFVEAIGEVEDLVDKRTLEKIVLPLFTDFLTNADHKLRTNVIIFMAEKRFRLGEDKLSKMASTLIAMNTKDSNDFKWMSHQVLSDIRERTSRKNLKVS